MNAAKSKGRGAWAEKVSGARLQVTSPWSRSEPDTRQLTPLTHPILWAAAPPLHPSPNYNHPSTMPAPLHALPITRDELDHLTGLDIGSVFMGGIIRPSVFGSRRRLLSLLITEALVMGTLFIIGVGLALVLVRQWEDFNHLGLVLLGVAAMVGVGEIAWHLYQRHRGKSLCTLAHLLDEVDRHNDIVRALQVMQDLEVARTGEFTPPDLDDIIQALQATRESLVSALQTDKILRHHHTLVHQRQELSAAIEANLLMLKALQVNHQASEYQQFLQEALEIGLAVQQELNRTRAW
jgi:hypothetical protein